jgi:hypothetical protein
MIAPTSPLGTKHSTENGTQYSLSPKRMILFFAVGNTANFMQNHSSEINGLPS